MTQKANDRVRLRVIKTIESRGMFNGVKKVLIGFSGGVDSSVLFDILLSLRARYSFELCAIHINHMIRGAESDTDEEFVRRKCAMSGVELFVRRIDVPALARESKNSLEEAARDARYKAFTEVAAECGAEAIATAHNADDNAETVIYNLARGASLNGICGIPYRRGPVIRPLLDIPREEINSYAERYGIDYVYDSTNSDEEYTRNKIRHRIIPVLKEINPSFINTMTSEANLFESARDHIKNEASCLTGDISGVSEAVLTQYILDKCPVYCDSETARRIVVAIKQKQRRVFGLSDTVFAFTEGGTVNFGSYSGDDFNEIEYKPIAVGENILADGKVAVYYNINPKNFNDINNFSTIITLRSAIISGAVYARSRISGDAVRINGMTKTLKKEFINKKIPAKYKGLIPVICCGTDIVCVPFAGVSEKYKPDRSGCDTFTFCFRFSI